MTKDEIRVIAENNLESFIRLVSPERVLGDCHLEVLRWWEREEKKTHQMLLFPRDHMKSTLIAYRVAYYLTKNPCLRILYISATANLAEKQLGFIKTILTSDIYRRYWPDHVQKEEAKREKWTNSEISLDHPLRKIENIRDPSVFTGGLTTSLTGLHCDIAVLDDVVVYENAYTGEGREKVKRQYSLLSSIEGADASEWVVGTRYHPSDLYNNLRELQEDLYDSETGEVSGSDFIYEVLEKQVEDVGDGTGQFLWPRQRRKDGKWFGFNKEILARKRGQYLDRTQYRAQYYNDPTDPDSQPISSDKFIYYDKKFLARKDGHWFFKERRLNILGAMDLAFSIKRQADYTAIVIIGTDYENNIYVLDIDRFRTDKIADYYAHLLALVQRWDLRRIVLEVSVGQSVIVKELKENYIKPNGLILKIEEYKPTRVDGAKEERMSLTLEPRYDNMQVFHYQGGNCQILEEELLTRFPPHDDVKDALSTAIKFSIKPVRPYSREGGLQEDKVIFHPRFGGRSF